MISPKMRAVVKREYLQQVRNKAFWISTFLIPSIALAIIFFQVLLSRSLVAKGRVGVVDLSGRLYVTLLAEQQARGDAQEERAKEEKDEKQQPGAKRKRIETRIEFFKVDAARETLPAVRKKLNQDVQTERIKAYIVVDDKTLDTGAAEWRAQSVKADLVMRETVAELLSRAATKERLKDRGVEPRLYDQARLRVDLEPHEAKEIETAAGGKNEGFNLAVSAVFFFLIYVSVFIYGGYIMRGVLEEKNNRIVEVIISSVRPSELMFGKILGIGLVGLTQYLIWGSIAILLTLPGIVGMIGMTGGLPPIPLETIGAFILFFILGYFLYASVYAAAEHDARPSVDDVVLRLQQPERRPGADAQLLPVHGPAPDVHAHLGAAAAALADRPLRGDPARDDLGHGLVRRPRLPRRHPDVWQETYLPRDPEVGAVGVKTRSSIGTPNRALSTSMRVSPSASEIVAWKGMRSPSTDL